MRYPGWIIFCLGLTSFGLNVVDYEIAAMMWVDQWGEGVGNGIRAGMMLVGAGLVFAARHLEKRGGKPAPPVAAAEAADG